MRVDIAELERIRHGLARTGRKYTSDLVGAILNCDHALLEGGFRGPAVKEQPQDEVMVIYRSCPLWDESVTDQIVSRLEDAWTKHGAFRHEAHLVTVDGDRVVLDFVTWWDSGNYYTGQIEIEPTAVALGDEPPAVRPL
jgi:hypothetical protein